MVAQPPVECSCAHGNAPSVSIKDEYLASDSYLLGKDSAPWSHVHESDDNIAIVKITIFCLKTNDGTLQVLVQSSKYYTCTLPNL